MLFNSYLFLVFFFFVFIVSKKLTGPIRIHFFLLTSLLFYSWGSFNAFLLISGSLIANKFFAEWIGKSKKRRIPLAVSVTANLAVLFHFKYKNFFLSEIWTLFTHNAGPFEKIALPLGISFFTFQQIGYLVDVYNQEKIRSFLDHATFIMFFPQLVAGPIVHHADLVPQFYEKKSSEELRNMFSYGSIIFSVGLAKKVLIADRLGEFVDPLFAEASRGGLNFFKSLVASLGYTGQIYFDFSGYSDMAIGLSLMLGFRMMLNFDSPYKSRNIIDFWRRWHISLGNFLRDYVYIPLGGNRNGKTSQAINLFLTMLIGGIWHGAGWTFIIWGSLHGAFLVLNHQWKQHFKIRLPKAVSIGVTFLCVVVGWIFFRATSVSEALNVLKGFTVLTFNEVPKKAIYFTLIAIVACFVAPNLYSFFPKSEVLTNLRASSAPDYSRVSNFIGFVSAILISVLLCFCFYRYEQTSKFLYFNF